jgi:hypothetical protein
MSETTLAVGHLLTLLEGIGYLAVAELLRRRRVAPQWQLPAALFRLWWVLLGAVGNEAYFAALYLNFVILAASLACLLSYFSFLLSGKARYYLAIALFYFGYYVLLTYQVAASNPTGVLAGEWRTFHVGTPSPPWRRLLVLAGLALPQLIAAIAYLTLAFRITERPVRFRITMVAFSVIAWTTGVLLIAVPGFGSSPALQVASRGVGLLGAFLAILAYRPPRSIQRWLDWKPVGEAVHPRAQTAGGPNP